MSRIAQILRNTQAFATFSEEELSLLADHCEAITVPKDQPVFQEGEMDDAAVYLIQDGAVKIVKGDTVLAMFGTGNFFGEMSFLDSDARSASAIADVDSVLYKLTPDRFYEYGNQLPKAAMKMFKVFLSKLVKRLRDTDEALIHQNGKVNYT